MISKASNIYEDITNLTNDNSTILISVKGVTISTADLASIYKDVAMGENVFAKIVAAHDKILTHGLEVGKEMVLAIDLDTGEVVAEGYGTEHHTSFDYIDENYQGRALIIHNHSTNNTFTPTDMFTFSNDICAHMAIVQAHNGNIFSLRKTKTQYTPLDMEKLDKEFKQSAENKGITRQNAAEKIPLLLANFVEKTSKENNWIYERN
ncbi:MAG: hypothetical protein FWG68_10140 [Defluviitaleaceae bacterium]|nr:hypothetical protein [Defluviitaleaceae bacterium]